MVLLATTGLLPSLVSSFSYWFKIVNPCFVTYTFCNCLWLNLGNRFNNCFAVCTRIRFWSYICGIHQAEIFFRRLKIKCTRNSDMPTALAIWQNVYLSSFWIILLTFETFVLHLQWQVGKILLHLWQTLSQSEEISFSTYELFNKTPC